MSRAERNASHRMNTTTATVITPLRTAFSLIVPNCSSLIATGPVSRTVA